VSALLWAWRHPRAQDASGRCIGRTDLGVDRRRAKRLAHRIRETARRHGLPRAIWTSPLQRGHAVGRWLRRWGWTHHVDSRLIELDFGHWDGQPWSRIPFSEVSAWEADFAQHPPGGGESLSQLVERATAFLHEQTGVRLLVGHAGWMQALAWQLQQRCPPTASEWPPAPRHGELMRLA
jgi:alpha-ribazole phosphatase